MTFAMRAGWLALCAAGAVLLVHVAERLGNFSLTPDSPSYLLTALDYAAGNGLSFPAGREPGYRVVLLALSRFGGWSTPEELGRIAAWVQCGVYVVLIAWVARELLLRAGVWAAALAVALFAVDRYHIQWVATVQSEAMGRLLILGGAALALWGLRRGRGWGVAGGFLLFGLIPLCRLGDMVWTLTMLAVPAMWAASRRREPRVWLSALGLAALLVGPAGLYSMLHGAATGFSGLSERGPWHLAGRMFTVVAPGKLRAAGFPEDLIAEVAQPIHDRFASEIDATVPVIDDLGQPTPLVVHIVPTPRTLPVELGTAYLKKRNLPSDLYPVSALLQSIAGRALAADPAAVWRASAIVFVDYATIPLLRPLYDKSWRNRAFLLLPATQVVALLAIAVTWRRRSWLALALAMAATGLLPAYFTLIAVGGHFNERFAGHMHVFAALAALTALCLPGRKEPLHFPQP